MIPKDEYLSDRELEQLIFESELNDMVPAPPELVEHIVAELPRRKHSFDNMWQEYRRYRFRVWTSVAAAVLMVFLLAEIPKRQQNIIQSEHESRTEKSSDSYIMHELLGGVNIFGQGDSFHFFSR